MSKNSSEVIKEKILLANEKFSLFNDKDKVLVGFSGGADSVTLLFSLSEIMGKENIHAFHVNHMLRGEEADGDEEFCKNICNKNGISFSSEKIDVASAANGVGVEEKARDMRYAALINEARKRGYNKIALAHTASDNIETVIFNLARGTGLSGMRGIVPKRSAEELEIIRPLILCTREEIENYVKYHSLPFCTDKTNFDTHYKRNFIRHKIVPLLKELNPAAEERASSMCELISRDDEFIKKYSEEFIRDHNIVNSVDVSLFSSLPDAIKNRVAEAMHKNVCGGSLEAKHFSDISALANKAKSGTRISLPGKAYAIIEKNSLVFKGESLYKEENTKKDFSKKLRIGTEKSETGFSVYIVKRGEENKEELLSLSENAVFNAKTLLSENTMKNLTVRNRKDGEKYIFGGMTRTLKKLISSESPKVKCNRPVFCDEKGIIWFPPFRIRDDVYAETKSSETVYALYYFEY